MSTKKALCQTTSSKMTAKTVALWHFDEPGGAPRQFLDASGNAHHLVG